MMGLTPPLSLISVLVAVFSLYNNNDAADALSTTIGYCHGVVQRRLIVQSPGLAPISAPKKSLGGTAERFHSNIIPEALLTNVSFSEAWIVLPL
jgi:hypothetical protein